MTLILERPQILNMSLPHSVLQARISFWKNETEDMLAGLLRCSGYPENEIDEYRGFYSAYIIPQLGPTPAEFGGRPSSYMGDDFTPIEFSWAIGPDGTQAVRFTMEPLSPLDGTPTPESTWISSLQSLGHFASSNGFDLTWSNICRRALVQGLSNQDICSSKHGSQFSVGCDFTRNGALIGKAYFLPHIRSKSTGIPSYTLVADCMQNLGLETPWRTVHEFIQTLPQDIEATPEIVSVDCLEPSKNRAKVYMRTNAASLATISEIMTLGSALTDPVVTDTVRTLERLWRLLFPNAADTTSIPSRNSHHYANGFVVYFEMTLGSPFPLPKVYIPVRHYCKDDRFVAEAISSYFINSAEGSATVENIKALFTHRSLDSRTGIYTYVGCAARKAGPQVSLYLSPEVFAPERQVNAAHDITLGS
ncbi:tryptophan dimethylallyltransferase-domain-containing protein [Mycena rosella]|uniref:Tryptophan dimethylallyltransferase-domain-containing protein n=1 Tax=Mycena rosella TaxID=1033263 RepID=A0AAD7GTH1_MYCRO|nr:tryptophan dimethylallyltransferase-domain-containing protein [Mycena rosella]